MDERGYWLTRSSNKTGAFRELRDYEPRLLEEKASWVRGLFDSEGNAQLCKVVGKKPYLHRRVSIYSTNETTLAQAARYLADLGIATRMRATGNSEDHKGDRTVFELALRGRAEFIRFADMIGSSIERKRTTLDAITKSFREDDYHRQAQLLGAAARRRKTMTMTLPKVIRDIRGMIDDGVKPTQRNCRAIPGYSSIQKLVSQSELIHRALELEIA